VKRDRHPNRHVHCCLYILFDMEMASQTVDDKSASAPSASAGPRRSLGEGGKSVVPPELVLTLFIAAAFVMLVGSVVGFAWMYWADEIRTPAVSEASYPPPKLY
jgi:hypothetical protein